MVSSKDDDANKSGGRRKSAVKPITIDLEATEVKAEETAGEAAAEAPVETPSPETADAMAPETAAEAAPEAPAEETPVAEEPPAEAAPEPEAEPGTASEEQQVRAAREPVRAGGGSGFFGTVIAALIGGGAALAANFALEEAQVLPFGPSARIADAEKAIVRVENRVATLADKPAAPATETADVAGLADRIAALEEKTAATASVIGELQAGQGEIEGLRADILAIRESLAAAPAPAGGEPQVTVDGAPAAPAPAAPDMAAPETPAIDTAALDRLAADLSALGNRLAAAEERLAGTGAVGDRVTAIEQSLAKGAAGEAVASETLQNAIATLSDRLGTAETRLADAATPDAIAAAVAPLQQSLAAANAAIEAVRADATAALAKADAAGAEAGKAAAALLVPGEPDARLVAGIDEVARSVVAVDDKVAALGNSLADLAARDPGERLGVLESGLAAAGAAAAGAEQSLAAVRDETAAGFARVDGQLGEIAGRVSGLESSLGDSSARERAAVAVAVSALQSAVARGGPFATELAAVGGLGGDEQAIAALAPFAETGLPTGAALARMFDERADAILAATRPAPAPAGDAAAPDTATDILGKFLSSAKTLVRVQPTGPVEGNDAAAIVSRIRAALGTGDLARALEEWQALPDAGKAAATDWAEAVKARIEADRMVAEMVERVLSSLAAPAAAPAPARAE